MKSYSLIAMSALMNNCDKVSSYQQEEFCSMTTILSALFQLLHIFNQSLPVIYGFRLGQDIMRFHTLIHIVEGTVFHDTDLPVPRDREQGSRSCRARQHHTRTAGSVLPQQDGPVGVLQHGRHQIAA